MTTRGFGVIVIGGGHAGVEAAWAAANLLQESGSVALVTLDPSRIGVMSCNPAIGGLAKGQLVREVDALGGLMALATDATGIQFRMLNTSKGQAVHGPRAQCDKHAYAQAVQMLVASRPEIEVIAGSVDRLIVEVGEVRGVVVRSPGGDELTLHARAVVLTTGTFMRGLMHTGEQKTAGGRHGEAPAVSISAALQELGFELGRLKTGTPPRLKRSSIRWNDLPPQFGDDPPRPFSDLTPRPGNSIAVPAPGPSGVGDPVDAALDGWRSTGFVAASFPLLPQVECRQTQTTAAAHELIRANLHRAPMYSGQIESAGPRYCPSIEDKVVRFAQRESHGVFLEPESHRDDWIYCNGISTSLPTDVQDAIVCGMPGCEQAVIYRYGYAVEYDMVRPHQITVTGQTRLVRGLYLAGQINGTSGYEEAAAQGVVAGINAALSVIGKPEYVIGRDQAYIGVLMDDLVTRTPVEPYRMFTSRAEYRLLLRADNAADRLTPDAQRLGLLSSTELGRRRSRLFADRREQIASLNAAIDRATLEGVPVPRLIRTQNFELGDLRRVLDAPGAGATDSVFDTVYADRRYEAYLVRQRAEIRRHAELEHRRLPTEWRDAMLDGMRTEARQAIMRFRPQTFGQASRLEGITPADMTLLAVLVKRHSRGDADAVPARPS
ncbi:MAG: tRNA uridine 5-carboxymethylaminomethyl modification enzyme MnmG [Phycisphaerae bacterium]